MCYSDRLFVRFFSDMTDTIKLNLRASVFKKKLYPAFAKLLYPLHEAEAGASPNIAREKAHTGGGGLFFCTDFG